MGGADPGKSNRDKFLKRKRTLLHKSYELAEKCQAKVYLIIEHPRGTTVYNSVEDGSWPPPDGVLHRTISIHRT
ncbi:hypothetical protein BDV26DRAFT_276747 [Aspergillus bertholletiae]|uniref:MADS-box domain-containing protein n=1 Tax=Aspergillus bertholletiae TaxID=1226010 RepID=A0A5N7AN29_9EURO|nr:hypothetical protein BDV26DRAFT_276747 [Aspergillus bertholletiae]